MRVSMSNNVNDLLEPYRYAAAPQLTFMQIIMKENHDIGFVDGLGLTDSYEYSVKSVKALTSLVNKNAGEQVCSVKVMSGKRSYQEAQKIIQKLMDCKL